MKPNKYIVSIIIFLLHGAAFAQNYRFEGYIQLSQKNQLPITIKLNVQGSQMKGLYYHTKDGSIFNIEGTILPNKSYELRETNEKQSVTGYFVGVWDAEKDVLEGKWLSSDRKNTHKTAWKKVPLIQYDIIIKVEDKKQSIDTWHRGEKSYSTAIMQAHPDPTVQANFNKLMESLKVEMTITEEEIRTNTYINNEVSIICATDDFISYRMTRRSGADGQGNKELNSFHTFDLKKGKEIHLQDIFVENTNIQKWLDPQIEKWQIETGVEDGHKGNWHLVLMESSLQLLFTDNGSLINFDELQYLPITIPYSEVKDITNAGGTLGRWLKIK